MFIDVNNSATMDSYYSKRMSKLYRVCREIIACSVIVPLLFFVMLFSLLFFVFVLVLVVAVVVDFVFCCKNTGVCRCWDDDDADRHGER